MEEGSGGSEYMLSIPESIWRGSLTSVELSTFLIDFVDGEFVIEDDMRQTRSHWRVGCFLIKGQRSIESITPDLFGAGWGIKWTLMYCRKDFSPL